MKTHIVTSFKVSNSPANFGKFSNWVNECVRTYGVRRPIITLKNNRVTWGKGRSYRDITGCDIVLICCKENICVNYDFDID